MKYITGRWLSFGEFLRNLLLLSAYKKVVVRLGASGITAKIKDFNFGKPAGKDDGLFSGSC
jgi:hypothetical protein